jgi:hypothetical protein
MSTTMDQIHHIREMYYQQDKNISEIAYPQSNALRVFLRRRSIVYLSGQKNWICCLFLKKNEVRVL